MELQHPIVVYIVPGVVGWAVVFMVVFRYLTRKYRRGDDYGTEDAIVWAIIHANAWLVLPIALVDDASLRIFLVALPLAYVASTFVTLIAWWGGIFLWGMIGEPQTPHWERQEWGPNKRILRAQRRRAEKERRQG